MKRNFIAKFVDFSVAKGVKDSYERRNPDKTYQIRRIHDGYKLVERVSK